MLLKLRPINDIFSESNHLEILPKNRNELCFIILEMNFSMTFVEYMFMPSGIHYFSKCVQSICLHQFFSYLRTHESLKIYSWSPLRAVPVL